MKTTKFFKFGPTHLGKIEQISRHNRSRGIQLVMRHVGKDPQVLNRAINARMERDRVANKEELRMICVSVDVPTYCEFEDVVKRAGVPLTEALRLGLEDYVACKT